MGIAGLSAASRLGHAGQIGIRSGTKFAGWQQVLRGFLMTVDDAAQVVRAVCKKGVISCSQQESFEPSNVFFPKSWDKGDWVSLWCGAIGLVLLLLAPFITGQSSFKVLQSILAELSPWP